MPDKPKIAIVGIGRWGKNLLREFSDLAQVVYCVHHGNSDNTKWLLENYPQITDTDYKTVLADPIIEAVIIATPIATHYHLTKQALQADKNVWVEKPLAESVTEASELVALAGEKKVIMVVGHVFLYHPVLDKIMEILNKEEVKYLETQWFKYGTFTEAIGPNLLSHDLALLLWFMGQPTQVDIVHQYGLISQGDIVDCRVVYPDDRQARLYVNRLSPLKQKSLFLQSQSHSLWWQDDQLFKLSATGYEMIYQSDSTALKHECLAFVEAITQGQPVRNSGQLGLEVVKLLLSNNLTT